MKNKLLPEIGFIRLKTVLKIIPIGRSTWLEKVNSGEYPKPVRLSKRIVAWKVDDIRELINKMNKKNE